MSNTENQDQKNIEENENEHFFLRFLNKKLRTLNKKLREIEHLELSKNLKEAQQKKVLTKSKLLEEKNYHESMKIVFLQAEKEYSIPQLKKKFSNEEASSNDPKEISEEKKQKDFGMNINENMQIIKPIFDFIYLSQLWLQCNFSNNLPNIKQNQEMMKDLGTVAEFYHKVFYVPQGVEFLTNEEKKQRYEEIQKYLQNEENQIAIQDKTYTDLNQLVKKYDKLEEIYQLKNATIEKIANENKTSEENTIIKDVEVEKPNANEEKQIKMIEEKQIAVTEEHKNEDANDKNEQKLIEITSENHKKNEKIEEKADLKFEKNRYYKADISKKYQLGGEKKKGNNNFKKLYHENNKKTPKHEYFVEYVKKEC